MTDQRVVDDTVDSALVRRLALIEFNDSLDLRDRAQLLYRLVTEQSEPVRTSNGVVMCRYADVTQVNRHPAMAMGDPHGEHFKGMGADHPLGPHSRDGEPHRMFRRLLDPIFAPKRVTRVEADVRALANELIDEFIGDDVVELHDAFCQPLPCKIFLSVLGLPQHDLAKLIAFKDGIIRNPGRTTEERYRLAFEGGNRLRAYLHDVLDERERMAELPEDLITGLIRAEVDGVRLTREEIVDVIQLFVIAGLDTVTSSLSCLLAWLAEHPVEQRALVDDPSLLPRAIEELLRFESPVVGGERFATEDVDINGFVVHKGEGVHVLWGTANLDPAQFADPLQVDFDREANKHIAFANGPHRCLGSNLARLELRLALEEFHRRIPEYTLDPGRAAVFTDIGVRSAVQLPIRIVRRA